LARRGVATASPTGAWTTVERGAIAVADRLDAFIPRVVRTPWGELELDPQHRWRLIHVACKAKDVSEFEREKEVTARLLAVAAQVPGVIGAGASVLDLADEAAANRAR